MNRRAIMKGLGGGLAMLLATSSIRGAEPATNAVVSAAPSTNAPGRAPYGVSPFLEEGLSEDQRKSFRKSMEEFRAQVRPLEEKLRLARRHLDEGIHVVQFTEADLRARAEKVGKIEGDIALLKAVHFSSLRQILPPEKMDMARRINNSDAAGRPGGVPGRDIPGRTRAEPLRTAPSKPTAPPP